MRTVSKYTNGRVLVVPDITGSKGTLYDENWLIGLPFVTFMAIIGDAKGSYVDHLMAMRKSMSEANAFNDPTRKFSFTVKFLDANNNIVGSWSDAEDNVPSIEEPEADKLVHKRCIDME